MAKYKKKPALIEATQWFKNGDHPKDESVPIDHGGDSTRLTEGKVVREFKSLALQGDRYCGTCGRQMFEHGELIDKLSQGDLRVCPGDYVVTNQTNGKYYRMTATQFEQLFELAES